MKRAFLQWSCIRNYKAKEKEKKEHKKTTKLQFLGSSSSSQELDTVSLKLEKKEKGRRMEKFSSLPDLFRGIKNVKKGKKKNRSTLDSNRSLQSEENTIQEEFQLPRVGDETIEIRPKKVESKVTNTRSTQSADSVVTFEIEEESASSSGNDVKLSGVDTTDLKSTVYDTPKPIVATTSEYIRTSIDCSTQTEAQVEIIKPANILPDNDKNRASLKNKISEIPVQSTVIKQVERESAEFAGVRIKSIYESDTESLLTATNEVEYEVTSDSMSSSDSSSVDSLIIYKTSSKTPATVERHSSMTIIDYTPQIIQENIWEDFNEIISNLNEEQPANVVHQEIKLDDVKNPHDAKLSKKRESSSDESADENVDKIPRDATLISQHNETSSDESAEEYVDKSVVNAILSKKYKSSFDEPAEENVDKNYRDTTLSHQESSSDESSEAYVDKTVVNAILSEKYKSKSDEPAEENVDKNPLDTTLSHQHKSSSDESSSDESVKENMDKKPEKAPHLTNAMKPLIVTPEKDLLKVDNPHESAGDIKRGSLSIDDAVSSVINLYKRPSASVTSPKSTNRYSMPQYKNDYQNKFEIKSTVLIQYPRDLSFSKDNYKPIYNKNSQITKSLEDIKFEKLDKSEIFIEKQTRESSQNKPVQKSTKNTRKKLSVVKDDSTSSSSDSEYSSCAEDSREINVDYKQKSRREKDEIYYLQAHAASAVQYEEQEVCVSFDTEFTTAQEGANQIPKPQPRLKKTSQSGEESKRNVENIMSGHIENNIDGSVEIAIREEAVNRKDKCTTLYYDSDDEEMAAKEFMRVIEDAKTNIDIIMRDVDTICEDISHFSGSKRDLLRYNEVLSRVILSLESVESYDRKEIKQYRKEATHKTKQIIKMINRMEAADNSSREILF